MVEDTTATRATADPPIAPISDELLAKLLADVTEPRRLWIVLDEALCQRILARIRAEQRRGDEEFNAGVEATIGQMVCWAIESRNLAAIETDAMKKGVHLGCADGFMLQSTALRALKRPIPTQEDTDHG